ncbi:cache domain-containing protein [Clostridium sp. AM58-1XD]|uniref:cache domain-containing protein n=1 Tax=Clostridium sp. AM58-1XD TaxID=2292307 RepID=UPI000E4B7F62|nr:cache domain-containing protein [Clostridium sp. AM58-1XD]RGY97502.1 hypothetical protein DXA13_14485 [Clostridium sp. AM58-1XD]
MWNLPIRKKIILLTFLQCLIVITFFLYSAVNAVQDRLQKYLSQNNAAGAYILQNFSMRTETIADLSAFPITQIPGSYKNTVYSSLSHDTFLSNYSETRLIADNIITHLNNNKSLQGISIYDLNGNGIYCQANDIDYFFTKASSQSPWFQYALNRSGGACLFPVNSIKDAVKGDHSPSCYYIARAVMNVERYRPVGLIVLSIYSTDLDEYFSKVKPFSNQTYAVMEGGRYIAGDLFPSPEIISRLANTERPFL